MKHPQRFLQASCLAIILATSLTGCSDKENKSKTQVAVKVGDAEVSVHQVNSLLARLPNVQRPEIKTQLQRQALERLVDMQLAYNQAVTEKLDRNPDVLMAAETAKHEIIARAYLERIAAAQPKPTESEIGKFFSEHPELFSNRKLYSMESLTLEANPEIAADIKQRLAANENIAQIANALQEKRVQLRPQQGIVPAEQVPLEFLPQLATVQDGQITLLETPRMLLLVHLIGSRSAPVDLQKATPAIQRLLMQQQAQKAIAAEIQRLKGATKIEYLGAFAQFAPGATPAATSQQPAAAKPNDNADTIGQGVAGLK